MAKKRPKCPPELEGTQFEDYIKHGSDAAVELALAAADPTQEMVEVVMWLDHDCPVAVVHICGEDIPKFIRVPSERHPETDEVIEWSRDRKVKAIPQAVYDRILQKLKEPFLKHPITGKVLRGEHAWDWTKGELVGIAKYVHVELLDAARTNSTLDEEIVAFYETYQQLLVKMSRAQRRLLDKGTEIDPAEKAELDRQCEQIQQQIDTLEPPAALKMKQAQEERAGASNKAPVALNTNPSD